MEIIIIIIIIIIVIIIIIIIIVISFIRVNFSIFDKITYLYKKYFY